MNERITVNICSKERATEIYGLLNSLLYQTHQDFDVVITTQYTTPFESFHFINRAIDALKLQGHKVTVAPAKIQDNIGHARNQAIEMSDTELLCRIDDDSICDSNYLLRLARILATSKKIAAVGGVVPNFGAPIPRRDPENVKPRFNKITLDKEGNITDMADDGGYLYYPTEPIKSHHLRSSFMFRKSVAENVGGHPTHYGQTGFREETQFCLKMLMAGYELWTDPSAICWHLRTPFGGVRSKDYPKKIAICDSMFRQEVKNWYKLGRLKL